ncbi:hypothetical protein EO244_05815 [Ancylomarina salipaludis]|uniref:Uncharacterized protein n=1 Tax=Ancylomarina salipaludis TaxID=2501299 RepID=A0A4Q1JN02_9BACT|nr:hypothetical protein [Ancylomarina salipaludis]RXQ95824.1 hypothetical protein EO244_05815 [Ancylomarina salipaludis]
MRKKIINKRVLFEFVSISFAVFLGMMLNTWKEARDNSELAEKSVQNIKTEILNNKEEVAKLLKAHKELLITVDSLILEIKDSIKVTNRTANMDLCLLSSTSWETAKITQAVANMNLALVTEISGIYEYQKYYDSLIKVYSQERMTSIPEENKKDLLVKRQVFISSIIEMEETLIIYYDDFLKSDLLAEVDTKS